MERILFYLPTVTPWWFDNIVVHMIRTLAAAAEVHVLVPPLWRNTGIGPEQLKGCTSLPSVTWHIADGEAHPSLRTAPADPEEIVEFARLIDPAYVFCRSADISTPSRFPGKVRHLIEGGSPPFSTHNGWIILQKEFWHHGAMPDLPDVDRQAIDEMFGKVWKRMCHRAEHEGSFRLPRGKALQRLGLPGDRKIIALPLEYEHEEAFTAFHNRFARNLDLIQYLAGCLETDTVLAVTDHPLNHKYVDNSEIYETITALGERAHLVPNATVDYSPTDLLIKNCDGLILQNTKAIYSGAFFGRPTLRLSNRPTAEWLGAHENVEAFNAAVISGQRSSTEDQARLWFGYHLLHDIIEPATITAAELLDRIDRPFSRDRLTTGFERINSYQRQLDLAA